MDSGDAYELQSKGWSVFPCVTKLDSLETFKLIQDPHLNPGIDVLDLICKMEWSKLQHLHLRYV